MTRIVMLIPIDVNAELTNVSLGISHLIKQKKINFNIFNPILQNHHLNQQFNVQNNNSIEVNYAESLLLNNKREKLIEKIISCFYKNKKNFELILINGVNFKNNFFLFQELNYKIAEILEAQIIFVTSIEIKFLNILEKIVQFSLIKLKRINKKNLIGIIINKFNLNFNESGYFSFNIFKKLNQVDNKSLKNFSNQSIHLKNKISLPILGSIPWNPDLISVRGIDIANYLQALIINQGTLKKQKVKSVVLCTQDDSLNAIRLFQKNSLLIISAYKFNLILSDYSSYINTIKTGVILLTDGKCFSKQMKNSYISSFKKINFSILMVKTNTLDTLLKLQDFKLNISANQNNTTIKNFVSEHINPNWICDLFKKKINRMKKITPIMFRYQLTERARQLNKRIILPESNDLRTLKAAEICAKKNIASCILLGDPNKIKAICMSNNLNLHPKIEIICPKKIRNNYINRLIQIRKNKGITESIAKNQLKNDIVLGTMMLENDEVDGLVAGAVNTTPNTIRPSLQLIKTAPNNFLVSSIFFMLLPDQVLIYGDCAINLNPTSEQLAEIAIQSANSAKMFGIDPKIAMISYSTGTSGFGNDVEKVKKSVILAKQKCQNLIIDGPLQYDTAISKHVAKLKAPNSLVAGKATVFVFPDLNTGNTTYKAVQRSANIISIGPMLQGMRKPVNDLSRGASVDDIVYTIALTSIQAEKN